MSLSQHACRGAYRTPFDQRLLALVASAACLTSWQSPNGRAFSTVLSQHRRRPAQLFLASRHGKARRVLSRACVDREGEEHDPGREELAVEYCAEGEKVLSLKLAGGGELSVTRHEASEQDMPGGTQKSARQEWRVLSFQPEGSYGPEGALHQAVVKVVVEEPGLLRPRLRQRSDVLTQRYSRSMVSVVLATLEVLGRPVVSKSGVEPLRILCVGLGAGIVSSFLVNSLAHCEVDAVELEPAVVTAAIEAMGLETGPRLRVVVDDGAAYASRVSASGRVRYDALLIDAFDAAGNTPAPLWTRDGGICQALTRGLLRKDGGVVAVNFLETVDVPEKIAAYRDALGAQGGGLGFSVRTLDYGYRVRKGADGSDQYEFFPAEDGAGNFIAVQTCGGRDGLKLDDLKAQLFKAGRAITSAIGCKFDMAVLAVRGLRQW